MSTLLQDLRFGLRLLAKNPGFTAVAVLTLALGIGGTTAIFSVLYGVVLNPFPYADNHRLAVLVKFDKMQNQAIRWASANEFLEFQAQNHVFDEVLGGRWDRFRLTGDGPPRDLYGYRMTCNYLQILGLRPLAGRAITPEDCRPGAPPVIVLSHSMWRKEFEGDLGVIGRVLVLNRQPTTIVGVMPPCWTPFDEAVWVPANPSTDENRDQQQYFVMGQMKPGVTFQQISTETKTLSKRFTSLYPQNYPEGTTFAVRTIVDATARSNDSERYFMLLGAVGLLLLIACVNVANLLLALAKGREKELAVRAALGATRGRLVRQFMVESLLVAFGGASLGCLLAWNGLGVLVASIPSGGKNNVTREYSIHINGAVLLFTLAVALLSTLLFGLVPALLAARRDLQPSLKASGRGVGESQGHHRLRDLMVVNEVALSFVLLTCAGFLIQSFREMRRGFHLYDPDHLLEVEVTPLPRELYKTTEQRNQYVAEAIHRLRALPGVVSVGLACPPLLHGTPGDSFEIVGKPSSENWKAEVRLVSDQFFETVRIQVLQGRTISEEDVVKSREVAVINRTFATKYLGNENPLGQQISISKNVPAWAPLRRQEFEIVGVVADNRTETWYNRAISGPYPSIFIPYSVADLDWANVNVRTAGDPAALVIAARQTISEIDKELPAAYAGPLRVAITQFWEADPRFQLTMLGIVASLGMVLVSVGVYSVLSYAVSRRTQEIGIRMALGAQVSQVRWMVMMSGLRWLALGIGIGVPASIALAKILQNRIWGIKSADPLTLVAVSLLLTVVGLAACYIPARRATKVDPMVALRYE